MRYLSLQDARCSCSAVVSACFLVTGIVSAQQSQSQPAAATHVKTFATPEEAVDEFLAAAEKFDVDAIGQIFGPEGKDLIETSEPARDREIAKTFTELAKEKKSVWVDPKNKNRALLVVGKDDWPFAVPIVRKGGKWSFDSAAGLQELIYRRIGGNELDAIEICHGYVEAQQEYALLEARWIGSKPVCTTHHQHARQTGWACMERGRWHTGRPHWRERCGSYR